jgi:hypothetical protein
MKEFHRIFTWNLEKTVMDISSTSCVKFQVRFQGNSHRPLLIQVTGTQTTQSQRDIQAQQGTLGQVGAATVSSARVALQEAENREMAVKMKSETTTISTDIKFK